MSDLPRPEMQPARKSLMQRLSIVWIVPLGALLISLAVVWQQYQERGPLIEITFDDASGVSAGETQLRYRDVVVGLVEDVSFTEDLGSVLVEVRLDKEVAPFVDSDAQFWVVEPEVTARGVRGLNTVLSGVYIQGSWDERIGARADRFEGRSNAPIALNNQQGLELQLRAANVEGLSEDTPILYRGIEVGRIANLRLADDGVSVVADGFIRAPQDKLVTSATRFWDTSGFSFSFGAQGAQLNVSSIASLLGGGVAFDTVVSGGEPVKNGHVFELYPDEETARSSSFATGETGPTVNIAAIFDEGTSGLATGAAVEYRGIRVGEVAAITGIVDEERFGDNRTRLLATLALRPGKLGLDADATPEETTEFIGQAVQDGMRAQLQNNSILSNALKVVLVTIPDAPREELSEGPNATPIMPTLPSDLSDITDTAEGVFERINELPIEELLSSAIAVMDSVNAILNDESLTRTPEEVVGLIGDIRNIVGSEQVQALPNDVHEVMASVQSAAADLETLLDTAKQAGAAEALVSALNAAEEAADAVTVAVEDVPATLDEIDKVAASADALLVSANELPLDELVSRAERVLAQARALIASDEIQGLPGELSATVAEAQGLIADVRGSGLVGTANATLLSAQAAVNNLSASLDRVLAEAETAAGQIGEATAGLPPLIADLRQVAQSADALVQQTGEVPLAELAGRASSLLSQAETVLAKPELQGLPGQVSSAVAEAQGLIADVRESGLVGTANATLITTQAAVNDLSAALDPVLASAESALGEVQSAASGVRPLLTDLQGVAQRADTLVQQASELPLETLTARASDLLASAETLIARPEMQALPGSVGQAVDAATAILQQIREQELVADTDATLAATEQAVREVTEALRPVLASAQSAADSVDRAARGVPEIVDRADAIANDIAALTARANELPLDEVVNQASALLADARELIGSEEAKALPASVTAALGEAEAALREIREGGLIDNANSTLAETQRAATAVAEASDALPTLVSRLNALLSEAESTIAGYRADGRLGGEAQSTLRDIREAAQAVESLSRTIERKPNSLLLGR